MLTAVVLVEDPLCHKSKSNSRILGLRSDLYAKAVTRVSLAKAVAEVDTGANATNTFPPAAVCAHNRRQERASRGRRAGVVFASFAGGMGAAHMM